MIGNRLRLATLPNATAYHDRVTLRELSRREILQAVAEYDRLGQDRFLDKYGFGTARSYRLVVDGKTYDSKAIVGAAHGFLRGQQPLAAADFSSGAATVGRLLNGLGFQVTQAVSGLTAGELVELLSALRLYRSPSGRQALYQPLTLLWAIGRAHQGLARMAEWSETKAALGEFLEGHGEHPRARSLQVTALYHAGLWDLGGPRPVPPRARRCAAELVHQEPACERKRRRWSRARQAGSAGPRPWRSPPGAPACWRPAATSSGPPGWSPRSSPAAVPPPTA